MQCRKLYATQQHVLREATGAERTPLNETVMDLVHDRPEACGWLKGELVGLDSLDLQ